MAFSLFQISGSKTGWAHRHRCLCSAKMPKRRTLSVALIGTKFMGRAHSNAWRQAPRFFDLPFEPRLKVICGRNRAGLEKMAAVWGWEEIATDWQAVVARSDIDLVDIATPNALHAPMALAA